MSNQVVQLCAASIVAGNLEEALQHYSKLEGSDQLVQLVEQAYANELTNVEAILNFSRKLDSIEAGVAMLDALYEAMRRNDHLESSELMMLAFRLNQYMTSGNYATSASKPSDKLTALKAKLPESVVTLLMADKPNGIFGIRNFNWEYLYVPMDLPFKGYRDVLTWIHQTHDSNAEWRITSNDGRYYTIQSTYFYDKHLLVCTYEKHEKHEKQYQMFVWDVKSADQNAECWVITPIKDGWFTIKHRDHGVYMEADKYHMTNARDVNLVKPNEFYDRLKWSFVKL